MLRQKNQGEDASLLDASSESDNPANTIGLNNRQHHHHQQNNIHNDSVPQYHQPPPMQWYHPSQGGYAQLPYQPPSQYNNHPSSPQEQQHQSRGGIHYSYLLLMALAFATIVQISKGGLFAYQAGYQKPQYGYPMTNGNLRNNYYNMGNAGMMNGMMNNPNSGNGMMMNYPNNPNNMMMNYPNAINPNNNNMMMMNNPNNMMFNGITTQQNQQQQQISNTQNASEQGQSSTSTTSTEVSNVVVADVTVTSSSTENEQSNTSQSNEEPQDYALTELSNFKDNWDPWEPSDTPVFFHIPKAGGSTIKDVIGSCHRFVMVRNFIILCSNSNLYLLTLRIFFYT